MACPLLAGNRLTAYKSLNLITEYYPCDDSRTGPQQHNVQTKVQSVPIPKAFFIADVADNFAIMRMHVFDRCITILREFPTEPLHGISVHPTVN